MSKHTQGPWYAEFKYNRSRDAREWRIGPAVLDEDGNAMVTKFVAFVPYCCGPEQQPNAQLIAAAPEMLRLIQRLTSPYMAEPEYRMDAFIDASVLVDEILNGDD